MILDKPLRFVHIHCNWYIWHFLQFFQKFRNYNQLQLIQTNHLCLSISTITGYTFSTTTAYTLLISLLLPKNHRVSLIVVIKLAFNFLYNSHDVFCIFFSREKKTKKNEKCHNRFEPKKSHILN